MEKSTVLQLASWKIQHITALFKNCISSKFQPPGPCAAIMAVQLILEANIFWKSIINIFQKMCASRIGCPANMAAQGLGGWNFEEIQFLNRAVICCIFQEASLKTVDFPQDELFGSQKSKYFSIFFASKSCCTATMAA